MAIRLFDYQLDAIEKMSNGCILCGGVGSGKSLTSLAYYYLKQGGKVGSLTGGPHVMMKDPKDLYIITTARKRDTLEWEGELGHFLLTTHPEVASYKNKVVVDSWNNIQKYGNVKDAFFIFDEQRVVGSGAWVKAFLKIAKANQWILLSATPGDTWQDYIPVFLANGFYKNKTEFAREHVIYSRFTKYPKVDRYINTGRLVKLRNQILVDMDFDRQTVSHHEDVYVQYDISKYKDISRTRWNPYKNEPIVNAAELCYLWRKVVNTDDSRQIALLEIFEKHPRIIVFYNFDYELELLKGIYYGENVEVAEWNGHKHQPIPESNSWVYLVQYTAGAEGWNCIKTDTIVFYSQNYSYKIMQQSAGRIDRLNTPYTDLYYYHIKSRSGIDLAISRALKEKKNFNESKYVTSSGGSTCRFDTEKRSTPRHVASCSFGKDSLAMVLMLIEKGYPLDEVVFYDTGMEFKAIYDVRDKVKPLLEAKGIKYTELKPERPFEYDMLERPVCSKEKGQHNGYGWCGGLCRWGTTNKTKASDEYMRDATKIYVGIAADEPERLPKLRYPKVSPLAEWGMTEADCLKYCYSKGFFWEENGIRLYDILDRVSCWCCANKNRKELKNIYMYLPEYWERLKNIQSKLDRPMKNFRSEEYGSYGNLFDMERVFKEEIKRENKAVA